MIRIEVTFLGVLVAVVLVHTQVPHQTKQTAPSGGKLTQILFSGLTPEGMKVETFDLILRNTSLRRDTLTCIVNFYDTFYF